jgi:hypothetical protein
MVVPNPWVPAYAVTADANPTTPNVILEMNYSQLNTASEIAERAEVRSSAYTGKLLAADATRKWSVWTVKAPCAAFIQRSDTTQPLFIGNSDQTGKVYQFVPHAYDDDGAAIPQTYTTAPFVGTETEQALQLGSVRKLYEFMTANLDGTGDIYISVFPDSLNSPYAHQLLPPIAMQADSLGDMEIPVNELGSRLFVSFATNAVGQGFRLGRLVMMVRSDPWSPVRGFNF